MSQEGEKSTSALTNEPKQEQTPDVNITENSIFKSGPEIRIPNTESYLDTTMLPSYSDSSHKISPLKTEETELIDKYTQQGKRVYDHHQIRETNTKHGGKDNQMSQEGEKSTSALTDEPMTSATTPDQGMNKKDQIANSDSIQNPFHSSKVGSNQPTTRQHDENTTHQTTTHHASQTKIKEPDWTRQQELTCSQLKNIYLKSTTMDDDERIQNPQWMRVPNTKDDFTITKRNHNIARAPKQCGKEFRKSTNKFNLNEIKDKQEVLKAILDKAGIIPRISTRKREHS